MILDNKYSIDRTWTERNQNVMTVCFTGHRAKSLCGYNREAYKDFVNDFSERLSKMYTGEPITFISGGAQGFDQLAFWAVDVFKRKLPAEDQQNIKNIVYAPFPNQDDIWADTGLFSKKEYKQMLDRATEVKYCLNEKPSQKRWISSALMNRNHEMVNDSDMVIAMYEDDSWSDPKTKGGTAECMRYAYDHRKGISQMMYTVSDGKLAITDIIPCERPSHIDVNHNQKGKTAGSVTGKNMNPATSDIHFNNAAEMELLKTACTETIHKHYENTDMKRPYEDIIEKINTEKAYGTPNEPRTFRLVGGHIDCGYFALNEYYRNHHDEAAKTLCDDLIKHIKGPHELNPSQPSRSVESNKNVNTESPDFGT